MEAEPTDLSSLDESPADRELPSNPPAPLPALLSSTELWPKSSDASKRRKILALYQQGFEFDEIAKIMSISLLEVRRIYDINIKNAIDETRKEIFRAAELAKLDEMEDAFLRRAVRGSTPAAKTTLSIMRQRADLMGLNAPKMVDTPKDGNLASLAHILATLPSDNKARVIPEPVGEIVDVTPRIAENQPAEPAPSSTDDYELDTSGSRDGLHKR